VVVGCAPRYLIGVYLIPKRWRKSVGTDRVIPESASAGPIGLALRLFHQDPEEPGGLFLGEVVAVAENDAGRRRSSESLELPDWPSDSYARLSGTGEGIPTAGTRRAGLGHPGQSRKAFA